MWDVIRDSDVVYPSTAATTTIIDPEPLAKIMETRARASGANCFHICGILVSSEYVVVRSSIRGYFGSS